MGNLISSRSSAGPIAPQNVCGTLQNYMLEQEPDLTSKLHNEDMPLPVVPSSEPHETSLRQTLINFLDKIHYSFTSYPEFTDLELAVRNEILSYGLDLRPGWEARLRTACTLVGMEYFKHPFEIQYFIAVCNHLSFLHVVLVTYSGAH